VTILFAGGGTGGHVYPAIAIADALRSRGADVVFVGTADRLEASAVPKAGYSLQTIAGRPLTRKLSLELLRTAAANLVGTLQSLRIVGRCRPDAIVATGGYVCFPVVLAARMLRAVRRFGGGIALLEPNARPGLTNRVLAPLVDEVWGTFERPDPRFAGKYVPTGMPVRAALRSLPARDAAVARLGLDPARKTLLAMGGSQGARSINDAIVALIASGGIPAGWQLVHVTGEREYDRVRAAANARGDAPKAAIRPYLDDLADAYAAADLVLARAGASTLGELAATGKPAILAPYPHATDDHQAANAAAVAATGAAVAVSDRDLAAGRLGAILQEVSAPARLEQLRAAASRVRPEDPVATILARVELLAARKKPA